MFIVKAEMRETGPTSTGQANYSLFQAERVRVRRSRMASSEGQDPQWEVELQDQHNFSHETLYVGPGLEHYCGVFIMNERGKTVDRVVYTSRAEVRAAA